MKAWQCFAHPWSRALQHARIALSVSAILVGCGDEPAERDDAEGALSGLEQALTTTAFTMSAAYYGTDRSGNCSNSNKRSLVGLEPSDEGKFPVFVYLTGTNMPFNGPEAKLFTQQMAARGFVAAAVDYDSSSYPSCGTMTKKASCIFNAGSANSAVSKLCSRAKADCSKGIVVSGFSQGANLSALAKNYDARARAAYLIGHGDKASGLIDVSSCADNAKTTLLPSQMRSINGENDEFFGSNANGVRTQLQKVVGVSCAQSWNCLQADGSGWAMVRPMELADGSANHCYYYQNGNRACTANNGFDAGWLSGSAPWALAPSLDWLASKATP
jgi:dienelactone hydrolase